MQRETVSGWKKQIDFSTAKGEKMGEETRHQREGICRIEELKTVIFPSGLWPTPKLCMKRLRLLEMRKKEMFRSSKSRGTSVHTLVIELRSQKIHVLVVKYRKKDYALRKKEKLR